MGEIGLWFPPSPISLWWSGGVVVVVVMVVWWSGDMPGSGGDVVELWRWW